MSLPSYENFDIVNKAYKNFIQKLMIVIDKIIRFIAKRGKCILQECFIREVVESIASRDNFFRKFKPNKLNVDKEIYNKVRNQTWKLISQKKRENIAKRKGVWKKAL